MNTIITLTPYSDIVLHIIAETSSREWLEYFTSPAFSSILFAKLLEFESVETWEDWKKKKGTLNIW